MAIKYCKKVDLPDLFLDYQVVDAGIRSLEAGQGFGSHKEDFFIMLSGLDKTMSESYLKWYWGKLAKHGYDRDGDKLESFINTQ